jgi:hypothetical protein
MRITPVIGMMVSMALLAGCASDRMDDIDTGSRLQPLEAQPVGQVQSGQLPDPSTSTSQFPDKPTVDPALQGQQVASANPAATAAPAAAMDVKKESMVGGWKVNSAGSGCDMFLTLTNLGSGSRGGTRGCVGPLAAMGSWEVSGKQVMLRDRAGNTIATLYKSAENRYDGTVNGGQPVSLSR